LIGEGLILENKNVEEKVFVTSDELTTFEKGELQLVEDLIKDGNTTNAIKTLKSILNTYPEGPASFEARFLLGEVLMMNKEWREAALVYLDIYSSFSSSHKAAEALYLLGISFNELGQFEESCLMFSQIKIEHQDSSFRKEAYKRIMDLNCQ
jgi:TolA-binding protein